MSHSPSTTESSSSTTSSPPSSSTTLKPSSPSSTTTVHSAATSPPTSVLRSSPPTYVGPAVFDAITCSNTSNCLAVGRTNSNAGLIVTSSNGGNSWTARPLPTGVKELQGIGCFGSRCVAVGLGQALASGDGGSTWSLQAVAAQSPPQLTSAACYSASSCVVGGWSENFGGPASGFIAVTSDGGGSWQTVTSNNNPIGAVFSVACPSPSFCVALGSEIRVSHDGGSTWALRTTNTGISGGLHSVTCGSATSCVAAGAGPNDPSGGAQVFTTSDGGNTWTSQTAPPGSVNAWQVRCASTTWCASVGPAASGSGTASFMTTTNGGVAWTNVSPPPGMTGLTDITCPTAAYCVAIGQTSTGAAQAIGTPGGAWSVSAQAAS